MYRSNKPRRLLKTLPSAVPEDIEDGSEDKSSESALGKRKPSSSKRMEIDASDDESDGKADISMERTTFDKAAKRDMSAARRATTATSSSSSTRNDAIALRTKRKKVSSDDEDEDPGAKESAKETTKEKRRERKDPKELPPSSLSQKSQPPPSSSLRSNGSEEDSYFGGRKHKPVVRSYGRNQNQNQKLDKPRLGSSSQEHLPKKRKSGGHPAPLDKGSSHSHSVTEADSKRKKAFQALPSDDNDGSPKRKHTQFKVVGDSEASNPELSPVKFQVPSSSEEPSQTSSQNKRVGPGRSTLFQQRFSNPTSKKKGENKKPKTLRTEEEEVQAPKAVFIDLDTQDLGPINEDVELSVDEDSSHEESKRDGTDNPWDDDEDLPKPETLCPWCGDEVDEQLLKDFSRGQRMNVRLQTKFCQTHKKDTAKKTWVSRGYPEIDWDELPVRIVSHYDSLLTIVDGRKSHYRTLLAGKIEAGEARSLKKEDNLNPGYYGPRGFNLMCDHLVRRFSKLLKERAVQDRVISGRGSAAFIQAVLVAELATLLIMDDMINKSYDEARIIMEESKAIGEIVNEEI